MVNLELLLKVLPPLLHEMEGAGTPYATQANTPMVSAVAAALSDMITIWEASAVVIHFGSLIGQYNYSCAARTVFLVGNNNTCKQNYCCGT